MVGGFHAGTLNEKRETEVVKEEISGEGHAGNTDQKRNRQGWEEEAPRSALGG